MAFFLWRSPFVYFFKMWTSLLCHGTPPKISKNYILARMCVATGNGSRVLNFSTKVNKENVTFWFWLSSHCQAIFFFEQFYVSKRSFMHRIPEPELYPILSEEFVASASYAWQTQRLESYYVLFSVLAATPRCLVVGFWFFPHLYFCLHPGAYITPNIAVNKYVYKSRIIPIPEVQLPRHRLYWCSGVANVKNI